MGAGGGGELLRQPNLLGTCRNCYNCYNRHKLTPTTSDPFKQLSSLTVISQWKHLVSYRIEKLSPVEPIQYWGGRPPGNDGYCKLSFFVHFAFWRNSPWGTPLPQLRAARFVKAECKLNEIRHKTRD